MMLCAAWAETAKALPGMLDPVAEHTPEQIEDHRQQVCSVTVSG